MPARGTVLLRLAAVVTDEQKRAIVKPLNCRDLPATPILKALHMCFLPRVQS